MPKLRPGTIWPERAKVDVTEKKSRRLPRPV